MNRSSESKLVVKAGLFIKQHQENTLRRGDYCSTKTYLGIPLARYRVKYSKIELINRCYNSHAGELIMTATNIN